MKGARLHLDFLRVFRDLAETRSFSQAATRNFLTQSAVSQQLAALERRFGRKLVDRGKGRFSLTEAGEIFLRSCRDILEGFEEAARRIRGEPREIAGTVRVQAIYSIGLYKLSQYVRSFLRRYPKVNLQIQFHQADRIYAHLETGTCDLGLVAGPWPHPHIRILPFKKERLALVCPPAHRFARRGRVRLAELNDESFVAFHRDAPSRWLVDRILRRHRVSVRVAQEFDNIETIKRAVEIETGVALLPEDTVLQEVRGGTLAKVALAEGPFERPTAILHDDRRSPSRAARAFLRWLTRREPSERRPAPAA